MYAEERQHEMARLVADSGRLSVVELADQYGITTETVRRDLTALERLGLVRRVHGGAVPAGALTTIESALVDRDAENPEEKSRIAAAATALLPPAGGTVLLDAGSTTARLAAALPSDRRLSMFTHALTVASRLATQPQVELNILPGRVRLPTQAAVGADTVAAYSRLRADVAFVGTNAISPDHGLSTPDPDEAATKRALVGAAKQVVVLADASKFGREAAVRFADLEQIDVIVTDADPGQSFQRAARAAGAEVVVA